MVEQKCRRVLNLYRVENGCMNQKWEMSEVDPVIPVRYFQTKALKSTNNWMTCKQTTHANLFETKIFMTFIVN